MRVIIRPGVQITGQVRVPGDKSIAHRWLILAAAAKGRSVLRGLPPALDVRSTAKCMAALSGSHGTNLAAWAANSQANPEDHRFTWDPKLVENPKTELVIEGEGWAGLRSSDHPLDCANSGTTMRLLSGALVGRDFDSTLVGDDALSRRPMERVAGPLRKMGAKIATSEGHAPVTIQGSHLQGAEIALEVASSQVKGALLLAGLTAQGETTVVEPDKTRDHTERALAALGAPVSAAGPSVTVSAFQHEGFEADLPGDPSSAIFLIAASALTGGSLDIVGVGLNDTRTQYLSVLGRMDAVVALTKRGRAQLGEELGEISLEPGATITPVKVDADELPLVIDDVVMLAVMAAFAPAGEESRFEGAGELRHKESDRLHGLLQGIRGLGGSAAIDGDSLIVRGGGLAGGSADAMKDHRLAMAFAVGALAARAESRIDGIEWADITFPGFVPALRSLGAQIEQG